MDGIISDLAALVQHEVEDYADGDWWKARAYAICDVARHIYAAIVVPDPHYPQKLPAGVIVMARVVDDMVIVDHDSTDHPFHEALMQSGVPREKIVLVYAGENMPQT